jgi:hypothetical protein
VTGDPPRDTRRSSPRHGSHHEAPRGRRGAPPDPASLAILLGLLGTKAGDLVAAVPISLFELCRRTRACTRGQTSRPSRRRSTARWRPAPAPAAPSVPRPPPPPPPPRPSLRITAPVSPRPQFSLCGRFILLGQNSGCALLLARNGGS